MNPMRPSNFTVNYISHPHHKQLFPRLDEEYWQGWVYTASSLHPNLYFPLQ